MKIAASVRITMSQSSLDIAARSVASRSIKASIAASDTTGHIVSGYRAGDSLIVHTPRRQLLHLSPLICPWTRFPLPDALVTRRPRTKGRSSIVERRRVAQSDVVYNFVE